MGYDGFSDKIRPDCKFFLVCPHCLMLICLSWDCVSFDASLRHE